MQESFGKVDTSLPHSLIKVTEPVKIMSLRRAPLAAGVHVIQGDVRDKIRSLRERRMVDAGIFSVEYYEGAAAEPEPLEEAPETQPIEELELLTKPGDAGLVEEPESEIVSEPTHTEEEWSYPAQEGPEETVEDPQPLEPDQEVSEAEEGLETKVRGNVKFGSLLALLEDSPAVQYNDCVIRLDDGAIRFDTDRTIAVVSLNEAAHMGGTIAQFVAERR